MKGDGFKTKAGGEISADREKDKSKTKANDWAEDAKLENYSEGKLYIMHFASYNYDHCKQIHNQL